jgi:multiple RNA-binding domain-containing protein 1
LFIRNLPFVTTLEEVREHFSSIGETEEVYMPQAKDKGKHETTNLATAFISYKDPEHAVEAYRKLKGTYFQGRKINVIPADYKLGEAPWGRKAREAEAVVEGKVLGKVKLSPAELKKKLDAKKEVASQQGINWATMYMDVSRHSSLKLVV